MQTASSCIGMRGFSFSACGPPAFFLGLGGSQLACGESKKAESKSASESNMQPGLFTVPQDQLVHLKLGKVAKTSWGVAIHTTGTVDWDQDHTTQAITQVA